MTTNQALGNFLVSVNKILHYKVKDYKSYILSLLTFNHLPNNYQ